MLGQKCWTGVLGIACWKKNIKKMLTFLRILIIFFFRKPIIGFPYSLICNLIV